MQDDIMAVASCGGQLFAHQREQRRIDEMKQHDAQTEDNQRPGFVQDTVAGRRDRFDIFGRPAVPVAGFPNVGRVRADRLVHPQKIRDCIFLFRGSHVAPSSRVACSDGHPVLIQPLAA
jgi:hypothetical protein